MEDAWAKTPLGEDIHNLSRGSTFQHPAEFINLEAPWTLLLSAPMKVWFIYIGVIDKSMTIMTRLISILIGRSGVKVPIFPSCDSPTTSVPHSVDTKDLHLTCMCSSVIEKGSSCKTKIRLSHCHSENSRAFRVSVPGKGNEDLTWISDYMATLGYAFGKTYK